MVRFLVVIFCVATCLIAIPLPTALNGPTDAPHAGLLASTRISSAPSRLLGSTDGPPIGGLELSLHNTMPSATGDYQQMVIVNSSAYDGLINSNWSNGEAFYPSNGTPIHAWIEANASNASEHTVLWLSLGSIPAGGTTNVSIGFWPKSAFLLSATGYMGEAPGLSSPYGAQDNGAAVFPFYDNFAGTSLSPKWDVNGSWNYTVHDGFTIDSVPPDGAAIFSHENYSYPSVMDFYGDLYQSNPAVAYVAEGFGDSQCDACGTTRSVAWESQGTSNGPTPSAGYQTGGGGTGAVSVFANQTLALFTVVVPSQGSADYLVNYTDAQTLSSGIPPSPLPVGLAISAKPAGTLTNTETTYWIRERSFVAQMPTVSVRQEYFVVFSEKGLPSGTPWGVTLDGATSNSTTGEVSFIQPLGTYPYLIEEVGGYAASPSSGSVSVTSLGSTVLITFTPILATSSREQVNFTESGLSVGTTWTVTLNGTSQSSSNATITFHESNGTYDFSVSALPGYSANPSYGSVSVDGQNVDRLVTFASAKTSSTASGFLGLPGNLGYYVLGGAIAAVAVIAGAVLAVTRARRRASSSPPENLATPTSSREDGRSR